VSEKEMNKERAGWARTALDLFAKTVNSSDQEEAVSDLLADLMHLCDEDEIESGEALARAKRNYEGEVEDAKEEEAS